MVKHHMVRRLHHRLSAKPLATCAPMALIAACECTAALLHDGTDEDNFNS